MAPIVEADRNASNVHHNTHTTTNNTHAGAPDIPNAQPNSDSSKPNGAPASMMSYSNTGDNYSGASERPTISLITGIPPMNKSASSVSSNPSSAHLTPSAAASTITTGLSAGGGPRPSSPSDRRAPLPNLSSSLGEKIGSSASGSLPSISQSSTGYGRSSLPSFHQQAMYPPSSSQPQTLSSPFPSPDVLSSRRDEYMPRPFGSYPSNATPQGASTPFGDNSELDDEEARARKRYGRPPGAKDKRPRRRRTKAQMEEDALIYGYRDSESVYHSPTSLAKRRRLSPRRDSIGDSPEEETESPQSQSAYTYPAYNSFLLATRDPNTKESYDPHPAPQSTQPSPTNTFNPYLHRHHLPMSSNSPSSLPSLRGPDVMPAPRPSSDSPWASRRPEIERVSGSQIPDSKPGLGDFGSARYPPSPIGPTGFSSINAARPPESFRTAPTHGDQIESRSRDPTPRRLSPPPEYRRDRDNRWDGPAPHHHLLPHQQTTLPRLGELPRLSELPLERPHWDRVEDHSRKPEYDNRGGPTENNMHKIPSLSAGHILNGAPLERKTDSPNTNRQSVSDMLRTGPEPPAPITPSQVTGSDRPTLQERSGSITSISIGPNLEADTSKRDEEDTDEQIEEYRAKMLEQHSSYYNCPPGKARVKREPSYAMPSKSPLHEENERLRAALQRYRQQKGIERLKLEEFINKRCNADQAMIKELLTITGHIAEDDYVGPVKPACL